MMAAPRNAAVKIPSASSVSVVTPLLETRTGMSCAAHATPAIPAPLLPAPSASPAHAVPWYSLGFGCELLLPSVAS